MNFQAAYLSVFILHLQFHCVVLFHGTMLIHLDPVLLISFDLRCFCHCKRLIRLGVKVLIEQNIFYVLAGIEHPLSELIVC